MRLYKKLGLWRLIFFATNAISYDYLKLVPTTTAILATTLRPWWPCPESRQFNVTHDIFLNIPPKISTTFCFQETLLVTSCDQTCDRWVSCSCDFQSSDRIWGYNYIQSGKGGLTLNFTSNFDFYVTLPSRSHDLECNAKSCIWGYACVMLSQ